MDLLKHFVLTRVPDAWLRRLKQWHYRRALASVTDSEEPDLIAVRKLVEAGSVAIDIGANVGLYTRVLSDLVGPEGHVISIEPIPDTFAILSANVRSLRLGNVALVNSATSAAAGDATMEVPEYSTGGKNFYQARIVAGDERPSMGNTPLRRVRVRAEALDDIVERFSVGRVGFVKCDVEGHELSCLRGATRVLTEHRPAWLVEVSGDPDAPGATAHAVFRLFEQSGYAAWLLADAKLLKRTSGQRSTNYFFLSSRHVARLRERSPELLDREGSQSQT